MTAPGADEPRPLTAQRLAYIVGQDAPAAVLIAQAKAAGYTIERSGPKRDAEPDDLGNVWDVIVVASLVTVEGVEYGSRIIVPGVSDQERLDDAWTVADHAALRRAARLDI